MLEKLKGGARAIVPIGLGIAIGFALGLSSQQLTLRQQAANLQGRIYGIQSDLDQTDPKKLPDKDRLALRKDLAALEKERITAENAIGSSLIQGLGGLFIFVTAYIAWHNLRVAQEKQTAERFSKAVEQLGSEKVHVRLGGIYALEQIAKDAEEKYYWQVMEILTTFVREESPFPKKDGKSGKDKTSNFITEIIKKKTEGGTGEEIPFLPTDIQTVLTVLGRRKHTYGSPQEPHRLDLRKTDLRYLQLPALSKSANLANVDFTGANMQRAMLEKANLQGALLEHTHLQEICLEKANLRGAKLLGANLQEAWLNEANLQEAQLRLARLESTFLTYAKLQGAQLDSASLQGAQLGYAEMQKAILTHADLQRALMRGANLQEADLSSARLQGAVLEEVKLQNARLIDAELQEAQLSGANLQNTLLQGANFEGAQLRGKAKLPGAIGLTWEQLEKAKYIREELPDYLLQNPPTASVDEPSP